MFPGCRLPHSGIARACEPLTSDFRPLVGFARSRFPYRHRPRDLLIYSIYSIEAVPMGHRPISHMSRAQHVLSDLLAIADIQVDGGRPWDILVHDARFFVRVLASGTLGFGESYMDGWWD